MPRYVDEHRHAIDAPRERVWAALRGHCRRSLAKDDRGLLTGLLGTEPRAGFAVTAEVPGERLDLEGRHRFSRYLLRFALEDGDGGATVLTARTFADFPGLAGRAYRALVVGGGGHAVAVRGMLRSVGRSSGAA